jgi:hypothetical protein
MQLEPPRFIPPQLTLAVPEPPEGDSWAHELKFDGYRLHARIVGKDVRLLTRTGLDRFGLSAGLTRRLLSDAIDPKKRAANIAAPRQEIVLASTPSRLAIAISRILLRRCRNGLVALVVLDLTANNLAVERQRLKDDVESVAVFVREYEADIEPEIILALAPNY